MSEIEPYITIPRSEDILTTEEAELIRQADRGELPCLTCGHPLHAAKVISEYYDGVILFCPDGQCGYLEL